MHLCGTNKGIKDACSTVDIFNNQWLQYIVVQQCSSSGLVVAHQWSPSDHQLVTITRVTSVKPSVGIITHQGHISQVGANAQSVSKSVSDQHHFQNVLWWDQIGIGSLGGMSCGCCQEFADGAQESHYANLDPLSLIATHALLSNYANLTFNCTDLV